MIRRPTRRARPTGTIADLRRRLQEAEDTLAAIREGHVEALVVTAPEGEQIYTLRSADHPYRLMVEQMHEGAVTLGADGTILYCNTRFAELVATPGERIIGVRFSDFVVAAHRPLVDALLQADAFRDECELRDGRGTVVPTQLSSSSLVIDGIRTTAVVVSDLTQERNERGLREANRLKDEFLQTLSHELRTPLNVIVGWTRMLLAGQLDERGGRHALELIERNAHAQTQLVNDLVDMSRLTTGKLSVDLESLPVVPAVEAAVDSIRPSAEKKRVAISAVSHVREECVRADATRLQQIFWNLLANAVKFTPNDGRIVVTIRRIDNRIQISIADSGIGIDESLLPHVFDRFRQADSGTTRSAGGLGLGLAIVRDLVRLHHGEVEAHSGGPGHGATFTVTLPVSSERTLAGPADPAAIDLNLTGQQVMLIEDHADSREMLVRTLRNAGAVVVSFEAASDAIAALNRLRPSVIVADIGMPGQNGYAFIQGVRTHIVPAIQCVPAVAVTAYASPADRMDALAAGFQRHVAKPIDPRLLLEAIHEVTRKRATH
jgi:PAS domain S-box-containing protein